MVVEAKRHACLEVRVSMGRSKGWCFAYRIHHHNNNGIAVE